MAQVGKRTSLSRSTGGTVAIFTFLIIMGAFMVLPQIYVIVTAFKPLDEILAYPPKFFVRHPTLSNFTDLIEITQETWIPFERSLFNSLALAFLGTVIYIVVASMAAFPLAKSRERFISVYYQIVVLAILFRPEVTRTPLYIIMEPPASHQYLLVAGAAGPVRFLRRVPDAAIYDDHSGFHAGGGPSGWRQRVLDLLEDRHANGQAGLDDSGNLYIQGSVEYRRDPVHL